MREKQGEWEEEIVEYCGLWGGILYNGQMLGDGEHAISFLS